jgi:diketogulonate reductase-like aldo/keto reductase
MHSRTLLGAMALLSRIRGASTLRPSRARLATMTSSSSGGLESVPTVTLRDGRLHPQIGFGTYKVGHIPASASAAAAGSESAGGTEATARSCVGDALRVGYRFLDCAEFYGNEAEVGLAIADVGVPRSELYIASKCWTTTIWEGREAVRAQVLRTISDLGMAYLDLYCIHWPVPGKHVEAYLELQALQKEGFIKSLGVSNYAIEDYEELAAAEGVEVLPAVNQIEINPFLYRRETLAFFESQGVTMQAYRALRDGKAFEDPTVLAVAAKHGKSAAQVLGRWCIQKGFIFIPKSVKKERMKENAQVFSFSLNDEDLAQLDALTTDEALATFQALYEKCVFRDTPADADESLRTEGDVKRSITRG